MLACFEFLAGRLGHEQGSNLRGYPDVVTGATELDIEAVPHLDCPQLTRI